MTLDELTPETIQTPPLKLEDGFAELQQIERAAQADLPLHKLPLIIRRTAFLNQHIQSELTAIEGELQDITGERAVPGSPAPTTN